MPFSPSSTISEIILRIGTINSYYTKKWGKYLSSGGRGEGVRGLLLRALRNVKQGKERMVLERLVVERPGFLFWPKNFILIQEMLTNT